MDLILSTALSSITFTIYLFKKNALEELKNTKPFPCKPTSTSTSTKKLGKINNVVSTTNKETTTIIDNSNSNSPLFEKLEKDITYYLEGIVSPINDSEFISCTNSKKKAVILKNIIKRHTVKWSNFWKDWIPEEEVISINGQSVPFNVTKDNQPQITIPKIPIQDIMLLDLPIISDNYISQNKKSIMKSIMDYVNGEKFSGIENTEKGFSFGQPITVIGKFKQPNKDIISSSSSPSLPSSTDIIDTSSSLSPEDLIVQSTNLPVMVTNFNDEESYCVISYRTFKEIVEEEGKSVNKWKWIFIGSTTIIGGVIAFRIWRYYRRKRRAEENQQNEELERLTNNNNNNDQNLPSFLDMLRDIANWLLTDEIEFDFTPSYRPHTPITEYIPDPIPIPPETTSTNTTNNPPTSTTNINTTQPTENSNTTINNNSSSSRPEDNNNNNPTSISPSTSNQDPKITNNTNSSTTNDENVCVICLTEKREYAYLPCRHLCVCRNCVHYLEKCPLCRSPIHSYMKIFS
ncbi:hypothetical protein BCR32DRAFT_290680 [Anaeromyces robustus]|uniref:RING-type domain-containing protein n=1 Tax=Anaeromyces robustus TaxID=1754192 RepID=A0A1Y1XIF6_9FUNG|nr:hypothetical protein BCR32DRAFT_290680 [Anaeromyces robustus]|eukprot:ORX85482.1 hypothetical protein BCR32DRAFT_290680 [Anaeromyces robustus]